MSNHARTFVGFGFGPIQSGLFLYEAFRSGHFGRLVVAEINSALVGAVRDHGGQYTINIAHADRVEQATVEGVELLNPNDAADRNQLIEAITCADELATALPSVEFYKTGGDNSVVSLLNEALCKRTPDCPAIIYAAENNNHAAEILSDSLTSEASINVQVLNTVIGKMSGVLDDAQAIASLGLATLTHSTSSAVLVEAFNQILLSRVTVPHATRSTDVFIEKDDLLPFEEAKLFGHNAIHALIGYLAAQCELVNMHQAGQSDHIMTTARHAFIHESGAALCRKYSHLDDDLFSPSGFAYYADDLLTRMTNPYLHDLVSRVVRDPERKCSYHDRLFGAMRLALTQGIEPHHLTRGAAAACQMMHGVTPFADRAALASTLTNLWGTDADQYANTLIDLTWLALSRSR